MLTREHIEGLPPPLPPGFLVAHRLDGEYDLEERASSQPGELRGAHILESKELTQEQSVRLRNTLADTASFGEVGARCFMPGVGFSLSSGADLLEILVCLQCDWAYFYQGETLAVKALSEMGHGRLAEMYVELFPGNDPDAA